MARFNEEVDGVYTKLRDNYYSVLKRRMQNGSPELSKFEALYEEMVEKYKSPVHMVAHLESIVLQLRKFERITDIKLGIQEDLVFARCAFFRNDKGANDIRAYIGTTSVYGTNLDELYSNEDFMYKAEVSLQKKMKEKIRENIKRFENYLED